MVVEDAVRIGDGSMQRGQRGVWLQELEAVGELAGRYHTVGC